MEWTVDYLPQTHLVRIVVQGDADRASLRQMMRDGLAAARSHDCPRFLVDHRLTRLRLGVAEIFDMPRRGEDGGFGHRLRVAMLVDPASPSRPDFEFYTIQCGNLGLHGLRLFLDEASALDWLASP